MTASIFVLPQSVSGVLGTTPTPPNIYPISSFTAFVTTSSPVLNGTNVKTCESMQLPDNNSSTTPTATANCLPGTAGAIVSGTSYWRVCLDVWTQNGRAVDQSANQSSTSTWGQYANVAAFTRCVPGNPPKEPMGSDFTVWGY
jgi:hypothetical protein